MWLYKKALKEISEIKNRQGFTRKTKQKNKSHGKKTSLLFCNLPITSALLILIIVHVFFSFREKPIKGAT